MRNKERLKKCLLIISFASLILSLVFLILNIYEIRTYQKAYNSKINALLVQIENAYPQVDKKELIEVLKSDTLDESFIKEYGFDYKDDNLVIENNKNFQMGLIINSVFSILSIVVISIIFLRYNHRRDYEINEIINLLERINNKDYQIDMNDLSEDILSILRQEICKTAILLNSMTDYATKDKLNLKESLSDISHQIKTPITSMLINLDLLIYNADMADNKRMELIRKIKKETNNINDLVRYLLTLAQFDVNAVTFKNDRVLVGEVIEEACLNVSTLCDLKNITIKKDVKPNVTIYGDKKWQIEALTNILKNSIEHSKSNDQVLINTLDNKSYTQISIRNFGPKIKGINIDKIFERFYKDENAGSDSTGIGLSLTKKIVEMDNGKITVKSNNQYTEFTIKYFKI